MFFAKSRSSSLRENSSSVRGDEEHSRDFVEVGSRATVVLEEIEGGDHRLSEHRERILEVILSVAARVKFG